MKARGTVLFTVVDSYRLLCLLTMAMCVLAGCAKRPAASGENWGVQGYRQAQHAPYAGAYAYRERRAGALLADDRSVWVRDPGSRRATNRYTASKGARSLAIPSGTSCLAWLEANGIRHQPLADKAGVITPVAVTGPIGGIDYVTTDGPAIIGDCRLIVALHWIAPQLHALGVRRVRHSGAYVYRTTRKGRLSLHALGLAIDLHEIQVGGRSENVKDNYVVGMTDSCRPDAPTLNHLACRLQTSGLFKELITPDHDRDHHDHLHLAIAPR